MQAPNRFPIFAQTFIPGICTGNKKRNLCKSRNYCVDMGWMACVLACLMSNHYHQHLTVQASADARDGLEAGLLWNVTLTSKNL